MKKMLLVLMAAVAFTACQKKQWYSSSLEIDLVKKAEMAFASGDMDTFRSAYADTAKIWFNNMSNDGAFSADTLTAAFKRFRANLSELKLGDNAIYEMVETDDGSRWVHRWGDWQSKRNNGKSVTWTSNGSFLVINGKIVIAAFVSNSLPMHLSTESDSTVTK